MPQEEILTTLRYPIIEAELIGEEVIAHRDVFDGLNTRITYSGYEIEKKGSRVNGMLKVYINDTSAMYDQLNYRSNRPKIDFVRDVYKNPRFAEIEPYFSKNDMHADLLQFCDVAYPLSLGIVEIEELAGDPMIEIEEYVKGWVPKGAGVILNAQPGVGKSWTAMAIAASVDAGYSDLFGVNKGKVLYINLERTGKYMVKRLGGINTALGLDYNRKLKFINKKGTALSEIKDAIINIVEKEDIKLIIVDSISRAGLGSLVEDNVAVKLTDLLNNLVKESDRTWLGIAHRAHSNQYVFGSIHFIAAADVVIKVDAARNDKKQLGLKLAVEKSNDMAPPIPRIIGLSFDAMGINGLWNSNKYEFPDLAEEESTK